MTTYTHHDMTTEHEHEKLTCTELLARAREEDPGPSKRHGDTDVHEGLEHTTRTSKRMQANRQRKQKSTRAQTMGETHLHDKTNTEMMTCDGRKNIKPTTQTKQSSRAEVSKAPETAIYFAYE